MELFFQHFFFTPPYKNQQEYKNNESKPSISSISHLCIFFNP